jgi:hypothetical protein
MIDPGQFLRLTQPDGSTVGVVVPKEELKKLEAEREDLRQQLAALTADNARLQKEREEYRLSLQAVMRDYIAQHEEEIEKELMEAETTGGSLEELIHELEEAIKADQGQPHVP